MPFRTITLTSAGEALYLPPQSFFFDDFGNRQYPESAPVQHDEAAIAALSLGRYAVQVSVPITVRLGDPRRYQQTRPQMLGEHAVCGGRLKLVCVSNTHRAIFCPECFLRVLIPQEVDTYGKLRKHAEEVLLRDGRL